jgi:hypothetical protein
VWRGGGGGGVQGRNRSVKWTAIRCEVPAFRHDCKSEANSRCMAAAADVLVQDMGHNGTCVVPVVMCDNNSNTLCVSLCWTPILPENPPQQQGGTGQDCRITFFGLHTLCATARRPLVLCAVISYVRLLFTSKPSLLQAQIHFDPSSATFNHTGSQLAPLALTSCNPQQS